MTMVLLSHSPSLFTTYHPFLPHHICFRNQTRTTLDHKKCRIREKLHICACDTSESTTENGFSRQDLVLFGLFYSLSLVFSSLGSHAEEELKMVSLVDDINAYSYLYPVELPSKKFLFKWVESRKPERYSSTAPLSPDARLHIVLERVDIIDNLIISVSVPKFTVYKNKGQKTWTAKDVADSVLSNKSALRVTSSQRMAESSILDAHSRSMGSHTSTMSTLFANRLPKLLKNQIFIDVMLRQQLNEMVICYSLNASTLSKQWNKMGPFLEKTVASFRLNPPTENYVPPYKDLWRFW